MSKHGIHNDRSYLRFNFKRPGQRLAAQVLNASGNFQTRFVTKLINEFCSEVGITPDTPDSEIKNIIKSYTSQSLSVSGLPGSTITTHLGTQILIGLNELLKNCSSDVSKIATDTSPATTTTATAGVQIGHQNIIEKEPNNPIYEEKKEESITLIPIESAPSSVDEIPIDDEPNSDIPDDNNDIPDDPFDESLDDIDLTAGKNAINAWNINL